MADPKEGNLTMCIVQGVFIVGRLVSGGPKLLEPRVFQIITEQDVTPQNQPIFLDINGRETLSITGRPKLSEKIQMKPLPGVPMFCLVGTDALTYPVKEGMMNIAELYAQITGPASYQPKAKPAPLAVVSGGESAEITPVKPLMGPRVVIGKPETNQ